MIFRALIGRFSSADLKVLSPLAALTLRLSVASRNMRPSSMQILRIYMVFYRIPALPGWLSGPTI